MTLNFSNHNGRFLADHFLERQINSKCFVNNKPGFDRILKFIGHVSQFSRGGGGGGGAGWLRAY